MIKTLKKKYVFTSMLAISLLLAALFIAINTVNIFVVRKMVDRTLDIIARSGGDIGNIHRPDNDRGAVSKRPDFPVDRPKNDYDTFMSSNFCVVILDNNGEVKAVDVSRTSTLSESAATEEAKILAEEGKTIGRYGTYRYKVSESPLGDAISVVFLDISEEVGSYLRVLIISAGGVALCWVMMLLLVLLLAEKAIRPIAENIERQKQFISDAGHEIKTPLAIIQANTEAMELFIGENKWSKNIKQQTGRLSGLMQNLLLLAKMDEGSLIGTWEEVELSALAADTIAAFEEPMALKKIDMEIRIDEKLSMKGDRERLMRLISILMENALKYTDEEGRVAFLMKKEGNRILLETENTCRDLPDVPPKQLFDRFYRGDSARTQQEGGYGIGLSAAKSIVEAHKGVISAMYPGKDRIQFRVELPSAQ